MNIPHHQRSSLCPAWCCDEKRTAQKTTVYGAELCPPVGLTLGKFGGADKRLQRVFVFLIGLKLASAGGGIAQCDVVATDNRPARLPEQRRIIRIRFDELWTALHGTLVFSGRKVWGNGNDREDHS